METDRFQALAKELAERDRGLESQLVEVREAAERLHARAEAAVKSFRDAVLAHGASHLASLEVDPVETDEKHVDCVQFRVRRGRWEVVCVAKAPDERPARVTLVGPYRRYKSETPCADLPLTGTAVQEALDQRIEALIREASGR